MASLLSISDVCGLRPEQGFGLNVLFMAGTLGSKLRMGCNTMNLDVALWRAFIFNVMIYLIL